eukprot:c35425_g1_i1 orf=123-662(+)
MNSKRMIWAALRCASSRTFSISITPASSSQMAEALFNAAQIKSGDVLVQNGADSDIGKAIIHMAKEREIKTINIVADKPGISDTVEQLKVIGGDIVVTESYTNTWFIKRLLSDVPKPKVGLNCSDGSLATAVAKLLCEGGTLLTYGTKLPQNVIYPGGDRRPIEWNQFLKTKKLKIQFI